MGAAVGDGFRNLEQEDEDEHVYGQEDEYGLVWRSYDRVDDGDGCDAPLTIWVPDTPPVIKAIRYNNVDELEKLLADPINLKYINVQGGYFSSPLNMACYLARTECIKVLLKNPEVDIAPPSDMGVTSFHIACEMCDLEVIQFFIELVKKEEGNDNYIGFFVNMLTKHQQTPLHYAAFGKNPKDIVPYLLDNGTVAYVRDDYKKLPADYCKDGHVKAMLEKAKVEQLKQLAAAKIDKMGKQPTESSKN